LPTTVLPGGTYQVRFATSAAELQRVQRLRFEVFNLELGEGLEESFATGLDQDLYDAGCHHLMVLLKDTDEVVGTYRLQTREMAEASHGWYTASEFDLSALPSDLLDLAVETGRACVAKDHRNGRVLTLLWKGLALYMAWNRKRYLFGCCSLTSQDAHVARSTYDFLEKASIVHPSLRVRPRPGFECYGPDFFADVDVSVKLPPLFAGYIKLGSKILGEPAIDREFKTIDYLTWLDVDHLDQATRRTFFGA
jgi:putative hemolysin